jgi:serine/threonine-protein kinase
MTGLPENNWKGVSCVNFLDQYEFLQILGQGAGSRVYLARHKVLDTLRAVKVLSKNHPCVREFLKEAQVLQNLNHPGIPRIYEVAEDSEQYYLIEEYLTGISLQTLVASAPEKIPLTDILQYGMKLCSIISYLHEQKPYPLLYLDFKPEHVICREDKVYLLDFGSVRQEREWSAGAGIPGTAGFVSPEVQEGKFPKKSSDIYGVGALLFFMLTGSPYEGRNSLERCTFLHKDWKQVLERCLAQESWNRYQTVPLLIKDLERLIPEGRGKGEMPSLSIAVAGAMGRLGVTHTALGLTAWLNRKSPIAVYADETKSHMVELLGETASDVREQGGILRIGDFLGMPSFGTGIEWDTGEYPIRILDVGSLCLEENLQEDALARKMQICMEADAVLLLLGTKLWELGRNRAVLAHWELPQKPVILLPFEATREVETVLKESKIRKYYTIPCFQSLWKIRGAAADFYEKLWNGLEKDLGLNRGRGSRKRRTGLSRQMGGTS